MFIFLMYSSRMLLYMFSHFALMITFRIINKIMRLCVATLTEYHDLARGRVVRIPRDTRSTHLHINLVNSNCAKIAI